MIADYRNAVPIPTQQQGNPNFPLPQDYNDLDDLGRQQARVNACCLQYNADQLTYAWDFFRRYYLAPPAQQGDFDPGWYAPPFCPSPEAHFRLVYDIGAHARNIQVFPRGFGKSKVLKELILLWLLTRPHFNIVIIKSHDDFVTGDFQEIMAQLDNNPMIVDDFGKLRPKRGGGVWKIGRLWLSNGAQLIGRSVMGKLLGLRPDFLAFDDAEFDPAMRITPTLLTENVKYMYFNHVRPMMRKGTSVLLIGTMNTRKSFLYYGATVDKRDDQRFEFFNRVVEGAKRTDGTFLWQANWNEHTLDEMKLEMGAAAFNNMMMNDPGTDDERMLTLNERYGYYDVRKMDDRFGVDPLHSQAELVAWKPKGETPTMVVRPFGETVSNMYRVLLADPIHKPSETSDWNCAMVIGIERSEIFTDAWWVLDMRLGRVKDPIFIEWLWEMGCKWMVRVVGVEAISVQKKLVEQVRGNFQERSLTNGWLPRVMPLKYPGDMNRSKSARISALAWRFEQNKIKLPRWRRNKEPYSQLVQQIEDFTIDLKMLPNDDAIDTLAMAQFVGRPGGKYGHDSKIIESPMELLEDGKVYMPGTNVPIVAGLNASELTPEAIAAIDARRWRNVKTKKRRVVKGRARRSYGGNF